MNKHVLVEVHYYARLMTVPIINIAYIIIMYINNSNKNIRNCAPFTEIANICDCKDLQAYRIRVIHCKYLIKNIISAISCMTASLMFKQSKDVLKDHAIQMYKLTRVNNKSQ